jgi:hypothetical protein
MIKKLRNQPYAPKMGASFKVGTRGGKKKYHIKAKLSLHSGH